MPTVEDPGATSSSAAPEGKPVGPRRGLVAGCIVDLGVEDGLLLVWCCAMLMLSWSMIKKKTRAS